MRRRKAVKRARPAPKPQPMLVVNDSVSVQINPARVDVSRPFDGTVEVRRFTRPEHLMWIDASGLTGCVVVKGATDEYMVRIAELIDAALKAERMT